MPVPTFEQNPLRVLSNAQLTFQLGNGQLSTNPKTGNVVPETTPVVLRVWARSAGRANLMNIPGVDEGEEALTAWVLDPMPAELPEGAVGDFLMDAGNGGQIRGKARIIPMLEAVRDYVTPVIGQKVWLALKREVRRVN